MSEDKIRPTQDSSKLWMEQQRAKQSRGVSSFAPHTPPAQRSHSTFSSPGSILGRDDDAVILELTPRHLCAGVEGESGPQCRILFGPGSNRRIGDYRNWTPGHMRPQEKVDIWGRDYELWRSHIGDMDLGLLSDKLERTVREVYNKYLLVDAGASRLILVLPSLVPHPVLETILSTLFQRWKYSSITLLPTATMSAISAGVRSALVIDIGWEETTVTTVYEYREVECVRSLNAVKMLSRRLASKLKKIRDAQAEGNLLRFDHDFVEDVLCRALAMMKSQDFEGVSHSSTTAPDHDFEIDWPGQPTSRPVNIPMSKVVKVVKAMIFVKEKDPYPDDEEMPLSLLVYRSLLALSPDVRGTCMSRIIFVGQGAESLIVRDQIMHGVNSMVEKHGWTAIRGQHISSSGKNLEDLDQAQHRQADAKHDADPVAGKDYVEARLQKQKAKSTRPVTQGSLREVRSLGPWAGASLTTSLKIRGFVEIDRERFLSHGLSGAHRDVEISVIPQQRMSSFGLPTSNKSADRNSWTLAGWG